jgi:DNA-directed RNA polymerase subunit M/transcription elongation factor TFIIS
LSKISGSGDFRCPKCGIRISPDDETEEAYAILETATKADRVESIMLQCNKCGTQIRLVGFDFLNETG